MYSEPAYTLRVIWACMKKDIKSALTERIFTIISVFVPLNVLILLSLFVLSGGQAPTAVVMHDTGPYAQQFYTAMSHAHSFRLRIASASDAQNLISTGKIVAVVTIPADFDARIQQNQPVQVGVQINNLNTDFTNDIRRAIPLSITSFYAKAFPNLVNITPRELDLHPQDTDYIPYLTVSILVIGLVLAGILQSATAAAREYENETIKELLLSPARRWAMIVGKMLGAFVMSIAVGHRRVVRADLYHRGLASALGRSDRLYAALAVDLHRHWYTAWHADKITPAGDRARLWHSYSALLFERRVWPDLIYYTGHTGDCANFSDLLCHCVAATRLP